MELRLLRLVIAAFIGFVMIARAVLGEPPNFSPDSGRNWAEAPVPATSPAPEPSPATSPEPEQSPATVPSPSISPAPSGPILAPPQSVPPPYRLPRRMSPPPREPREFPPPLLPAAAPGGALNDGKRVGLLFAGMAATLQVFVAAYIIYKRRQLF